ncbi:MAG: T9SS C-terminal target domain-containing protein [Candidatus Zixiibacteriota bacterium]|nr:MAG: T9SS C-terminal target domain-containing protein [candidate division Zixibacteria bacterium]
MTLVKFKAILQTQKIALDLAVWERYIGCKNRNIAVKEAVMKRARGFLGIAAAVAVLVSVAAAQWSDPVAVTEGEGDDHNVAIWDVGYGQTTIVWDRTDSTGTHLFYRTVNLVTSEFGPETQLTFGACRDEKPSMAPDGCGVFFQSDRQGHSAIYFLEDLNPAEPFRFLYSDVDLWDPQARYGGICTPDPFLVICHSDSQFYTCDFDWFLYEIHQSTYLAPSGDHPIKWADGGVLPNPPLYSLFRRVCESVLSGNSEIEFYWQYAYAVPGLADTLVNTTGFPRHRPQLDTDAILFEQETANGSDLYRAEWNYIVSNFYPAQPLFEHDGTERNLTFENGSGAYYAFEQDWVGNWDIGFRAHIQNVTEVVCPSDAVDRNPVLRTGYGWTPAAGYHVFWESNRDGTWKIYHSQRDAVGVDDGFGPLQPKQIGLSVHPNPGNAEFKIALDLARAGQAQAGIYDVSGRLVQRVHSGWLGAGRHAFTWNAVDQPSGIYFLRVESGGAVTLEKVALLK